MGFEEIATKEDLKALETRIAAEVAKIIPASDSPYMLLEDAARYIQTAPRTLREKAHTGEVAYILDGRLLKFNKKDLDTYMANRRIRSNDEVNALAAART